MQRKQDFRRADIKNLLNLFIKEKEFLSCDYGSKSRIEALRTAQAI